MTEEQSPKVRESTEPPKAAGNRGKGRKKGVPNKATASLKELAREYTTEALTTLSSIMLQGESEPARIAAAKELLDRGYGKASQVIAGDEDGGPVKIEAVEWRVRH